MPLNQSVMVPPSIRPCVDWTHIRQAKRFPDRKLTPVGLALVEQARFSTGQFTDEAIVLIDGQTHAEARYTPNPERSAYLARYQRGEPIQPATFRLTLAVA